jgi:acyl-coenzyme A synthetase/AMP-(fatty) acid ligase/ankyrin repeat protein
MRLADLDPSSTALVWYSDDTTTTTTTTRSVAVDEDESSSGSYWSGLETVAVITSDDPAAADPANHERNRTRLLALPYRVILPLVARLVLRLQQKFTSDTDEDHHDNDDDNDDGQLEKQCQRKEGVTNLRPALFMVVAVAIPEGPYQCLAVAAVHCWKSAVLLPMDPRAEGRERLRHGLAMADLVLVASDHDIERLQQLIMIATTTTLPDADTAAAAASGESKNADGKTTRQRPPLPPQIWNVKDLLATEILEYHHQHQHTSPLPPPPPVEQQGDASSDDDVASSPLVLPPGATDRGSSLSERIARWVPEHQRIHFATNNDNDDDDTDNTVTDGGGTNTSSSSCSKMSHMVLTSGTSGGRPKVCVSSRRALLQYIGRKNAAHDITASSVVLLASNLSFDPCFSDILATWSVGATLQLARPGCGYLFAHLDHVTHILTTPSLWNSSMAAAAVSDAASARAVAPRLQVLALGGEQIPPSLRTVWSTVPGLRLCATYGVTEACVYQTIGDIVTTTAAETTTPRTMVGTPLGDMAIRICDEHRQDALIDIELSSSPDNPGEIVLRGSQIDALSGYYQAPEMTAAKFVAVADDRTGKMVYHYRTGDRGFVDTATGQLHVLGRIAGEDDTVKFRGVRVDLRELEYALLNVAGVVSDAMVAAVQDEEMIDTTSVRDIVAYVVLHERCRTELHKYVADWPAHGLLCRDPALAWLLYTSCASTARTSPTKFILLPRLPLTATGKRDRRALPSVDQAVPMPSVAHAPALTSYGRCGRIVAQEIIACLNLSTSAEQDLLTVAATFSLLGGDSLSATRVVRAVYARHHQIHDTRHLGGPTGTLDGPFAVQYFLRAENLGQYVDWLDRNGVCTATSDDVTASEHGDTTLAVQSGGLVHPHNPNPGYSALLHATAAGFSVLAVALLQQCGVDPNHGQHEGRLGKTNRLERKRNFRSTPLHLACLAGMDDLVTALLDHGANPKCPNASGMFPIHLAASGSLPVGDVVPLEEQSRRLICCTQLLAHGSPLVMADGSQQTILHAAARSGQTLVLQWALARWPPTLLNLRDQWSRTPVHWAVLNGRGDGLRALLATPGCDPCPRVFGSQHVKSSVALETPLEICRRVHGGDSMTALGQSLEAELVSAMQSGSKQTTTGEQQQQQQLNS